jgi:transketolase
MFSDYMRPPIRLAALMGLHVVHVFTHESLAQGWYHHVGDAGDMLGVERFGASAPAEVRLGEYGFIVDGVGARAKALLG